jgi:hypothetical protein
MVTVSNANTPASAMIRIESSSFLFGSGSEVAILSSVQNRSKEGLHLRRVIDTKFCKRCHGCSVRLPIEKGVTGAADLHELHALACLDKRIDEFGDSGIRNQGIPRPSDQVLADLRTTYR